MFIIINYYHYFIGFSSRRHVLFVRNIPVKWPIVDNKLKLRTYRLNKKKNARTQKGQNQSDWVRVVWDSDVHPKSINDIRWWSLFVNNGNYSCSLNHLWWNLYNWCLLTLFVWYNWINICLFLHKFSAWHKVNQINYMNATEARNSTNANNVRVCMRDENAPEHHSTARSTHKCVLTCDWRRDKRTTHIVNEYFSRYCTRPRSDTPQ